MRLGPRSWISPSASGPRGVAGVDVDDADLDPREGAAAAALLARRERLVEAVAAVRAERLGHAEQVRPRPGRHAALGREDRVEAAGAQRVEIGVGEPRIRGPAPPPGRANPGTA